MGFKKVPGGADRNSQPSTFLPTIEAVQTPESEGPQPPDAPVGAALRSLGALC